MTICGNCGAKGAAVTRARVAEFADVVLGYRVHLVQFCRLRHVQ